MFLGDIPLSRGVRGVFMLVTAIFHEHTPYACADRSVSTTNGETFECRKTLQLAASPLNTDDAAHICILRRGEFDLPS